MSGDGKEDSKTARSRTHLLVHTTISALSESTGPCIPSPAPCVSPTTWRRCHRGLPHSSASLPGRGPRERESRSTGQWLEREGPQGSSPLDKRDPAPASVALDELVISLGTGEKSSMLEAEFLHLSSVWMLKYGLNCHE